MLDISIVDLVQIYAYKSIKQTPKRVIVIGPSHRVYIDGASVALQNEYETPLGNIEIDTDYSKRLINSFEFLNFQENAHQEHSTENQAPFIKYYFPDSKIIEIVLWQDRFYKNL